MYYLGLVLTPAFYLFLSLNIRPIADDYCTAAGVKQGFWEYVYNISQNWGGDYSQIFLGALLVGFPLANWPIWTVGFTTMFFCMILLALLTLRISFWLSPGQLYEHSRKLPLIGISIILLLWNLYWALPASVKINHYYNAFAMSEKTFAGVFGWSTVIIQYLVIPLLISLSLFIRTRSTFLGLLIVFSIAFFSGMSGYALALSLSLSSVFFQLIQRLRMRGRNFLLIQAGLWLGILLSYFSPGSRARSAALFSEESATSQISLSRWVFISILEFISSIINLGTIGVAFISFLFFIIYQSRKSFVIDVTKLNALLLILSSFLCIYYAVISFSEYLTYEAFWHLITYRAVLFVFCFCLGLSLANFLRVGNWFVIVQRYRNFLEILLLTMVVLGLACSLLSNNTIVNRAKIWSMTAAPLPGIGDIEPRGGWIDQCWQQLKKSRNISDRN